MLTAERQFKFIKIKEKWFASSYSIFDVFRIISFNNFKARRPIGLFKHASFSLQTCLSDSLDDIYASFKSNTRNEIKRAEKEGVDFVINEQSYDDFILLFNDFASRRNLPLMSMPRLLKYKMENLIILSAMYKSNIIVSNVYLIDGESTRLLHSINIQSDDNELKKLVGWANRYIHWMAIKFFKDMNYLIYDWGGVSDSSNPILFGIDKFKESFGGQKIQVNNYRSFTYLLLLKLDKYLNN